MSIVAKLQRESIRLSQIQDIAGCRVVVDDVIKQDEFVRVLGGCFPGAAVIDRRNRPDPGYRAVHLIVKSTGKAVEIQIRSKLQHLWAELSERFSDIFGANIKYGKGNDRVLRILKLAAFTIRSVEDDMRMIHSAPDEIRTDLELDVQLRRDETEKIMNWIKQILSHVGREQ